MFAQKNKITFNLIKIKFGHPIKIKFGPNQSNIFSKVL